jgi:hypothetical protein
MSSAYRWAVFYWARIKHVSYEITPAGLMATVRMPADSDAHLSSQHRCRA